MVTYFERVVSRYFVLRLNMKLNRIIHMQREIMADLTALNQAVVDNTNAVDAVKALVDQLKSANDQAAIDAIAQKIVENNAAMAAIVAPSS